MQAVNSLRIAPYPLDSTLPVDRDSVSVAIENRTLWACFIMDRMISSGTYNPPMLPMSEMEKLKVSRPLNDVEFAFSPNMTAQLNSIDQGLAIPNHVHGVILDITQSFEILVAGFDIWAKVMTFIFNDGRRAPGMCAPENCPWVPGSPWWKARSQLETWRANQHHRLHYPDSTVAVHMTLGYGESFTYLNLLYYLWYGCHYFGLSKRTNLLEFYPVRSCFIANISLSCLLRNPSQVAQLNIPCSKPKLQKPGGMEVPLSSLRRQSTFPSCCMMHPNAVSIC